MDEMKSSTVERISLKMEEKAYEHDDENNVKEVKM
jgi:hypothetical protein